MRRIVIIVVLALLAWQGYGDYKAKRDLRAEGEPTSAPLSPADTTTPSITPLGQFKCDDRTHCSQMTSCEEATFFLKSCPGVKMDGNNDGIPCEKQWCGR